MAAATSASKRAHSPVEACRDALEASAITASTSRKTAIDRIPGDGTSEEPFDPSVDLPHVHRAISLHQNLDHGPLNHPIGEQHQFYPRGRCVAK